MRDSTMKDGNSVADGAFLEAQRRTLMSLRDTLRFSQSSAHNEESEVRISREPQEPEDDAQRLASAELSENLERRDASRLAAVERALQKLDEGTYGISDASGAVIPKERLERVPEAALTLEEEQEKEAAAISGLSSRGLK
jgi:DnaK suppressor protein